MISGGEFINGFDRRTIRLTMSMLASSLTLVRDPGCFKIHVMLRGSQVPRPPYGCMEFVSTKRASMGF